MKLAPKTIRWATTALAAVVLVPVAQAQMGMGQGMRMPMPRYDTSRVVTVQGTVQEVEDGMMPSGPMGPMMGTRRMGLHLVLKTDKETLTILAGPSGFAKGEGFNFVVGDKIEVIGSKVQYNDADAVIAREIKKGGKTLTLRDEKGIPKWSRGRSQS